MIAVDTNILVYAHRAECAFYAKASAFMSQLAEGSSPWAIAWPCLHEFLAIVTHPKIYDPPTLLGHAQNQVECWRESPSLVLLAERSDYWQYLKSLLNSGNIVGPAIHDGHVAAICLNHGVSTVYSADRNFTRIKGLKLINPLL